MPASETVAERVQSATPTASESSSSATPSSSAPTQSASTSAPITHDASSSSASPSKLPAPPRHTDNMDVYEAMVAHHMASLSLSDSPPASPAPSTLVKSAPAQDAVEEFPSWGDRAPPKIYRARDLPNGGRGMARTLAAHTSTQAHHRNTPIAPAAGTTTRAAEAMADEDEYVVDIYFIATGQSAGAVAAVPEGAWAEVTWAEDGEFDDTDSDAELADDDEDSNAESYYANSYPDEDAYPSSVDGMDDGNAVDDDSVVGDPEEEEEYLKGVRRVGRSLRLKRHGHGDDERESGEEDDEEDAVSSDEEDDDSEDW
ncbi:hypothetical protein HDU93_004154 [Gonapodya sp. JEL0774]|nr:hypothetical protein HDU93_004154 [Gonapodya sp. JEL0774]